MYPSCPFFLDLYIKIVNVNVKSFYFKKIIFIIIIIIAVREQIIEL